MKWLLVTSGTTQITLNLSMIKSILKNEETGVIEFEFDSGRKWKVAKEADEGVDLVIADKVDWTNLVGHIGRLRIAS
jgi:hypothetical protein